MKIIFITVTIIIAIAINIIFKIQIKIVSLKNLKIVEIGKCEWDKRNKYEREFINMVNLMGKEHIHGRMVVNTQENLKKVNLMGKEH